MIIDLNQPLFLVDNQAVKHRVIRIDVLNKLIICKDSEEAPEVSYEYSVSNAIEGFTVIAGDFT